VCGSRIELERERRKERAYGKHLFLGWEDFVVPKEGPGWSPPLRAGVSIVSDEETAT
jgi:hypothetical protein